MTSSAGAFVPASSCRCQDLTRSTPQELIARDANAALFYYAQVWALVHFLNEGEGGRSSARG
jgi:hypothetical protein